MRVTVAAAVVQLLAAAVSAAPHDHAGEVLSGVVGGWRMSRRAGAGVWGDAVKADTTSYGEMGKVAAVALAQQAVATSRGCPSTTNDTCSGRGSCEDDICQCNDGYKGASCEQFSCDQVEECNQRGNCTAVQTCTCLYPWDGAQCELDGRCQDNCHGNGHCLYGNGSCVCDTGYEGDRCASTSRPIQYRQWTRLYPPTGDASTPRRGNVGAKPVGRYGHSISALPPNDDDMMVDGFIMFGGRNDNRVLADMWMYKTADKSWHHRGQFSAGPGRRFSHSLTTMGNSVVLYGGIADDDPSPTTLADMWQYLLAEEAWQPLNVAVSTDRTTGASVGGVGGRAEHTAASMWMREEDGVTYRSVMVLYGGMTSSTKDYTFNPHAWGFVVEAMAWMRMAECPTGGRRGHTAAVTADGDYMLVFGGLLPSGTAVPNALHSYRLSTNEWELLAPPDPTAPTARAYHVTAMREGKMFIMGGHHAGLPLDDGWVWDVVGGGWAQLENGVSHKPSGRAHAALAVVGAEVLVGFGGVSGGGSYVPTSEVWEFHPEAGAWSRPITTGALPEPRMLNSGVIIEHTLMVFGGESIAGKFHRALWKFDLGGTDAKARFTWRQVLPTWLADEPGVTTAMEGDSDDVTAIKSKHGCTCKNESVDGDTGLKHTGCAAQSTDDVAWCDTVEACRFLEFWDYCDDSQVPPPPPSNGHVRHHHSLAHIQSALVQDKATDDAPASLQSWPTARSGHAAATAAFTGMAAGACGRGRRTTMLVFGGAGEGDTLYNDLLVFCPRSNQWAELSPNQAPSLRAPTPRSSAALAVVGGDVYMFGGLLEGRKRANDLWRCDLAPAPGAAACSEVVTAGWTPQRRRGMVLSLDSVRSCPQGCAPQPPKHLVMFNGYWTADTGSHNATAIIQHRCVALKPPWTDRYCDRTCHVAPSGAACTSRCRCKVDHNMDLWTLDLATHRWDTIHPATGPPSRFAAQATTFEGRLWVFGGYSGTQELSDLWSFDHATATWKALETQSGVPQPGGRHEAVAAMHGSALTLFGGIDAEIGLLNDVWSVGLGDVSHE